MAKPPYPVDDRPDHPWPDESGRGEQSSPTITTALPLILASGSRYRAELLSRLRLPFVALASQADETRLPGESPLAFAERLAEAKARVLSRQHCDRWVLGSDQVVACGDAVLGKPGTRADAIAQLRAQSGRLVEFITAVALVHEDSGALLRHVDRTRVRFRTLGDAEIERYVDAEPALDCAGSFKSEGLGITLVEAIESEDATGLVGLPLIAVRRLLATAGHAVP